MKTKIRTLTAVAFLCAAALLMAALAGIFAYRAKADETQASASVIAAETPFGEITKANGAEWGDTSLETRNINPLQSSGKSIEYMNKAVAWWTLERTLETSIDAEATLGVNYDGSAKTSDLGVAFWVFIADETTREAVKSVTVKVWIGPDSGNNWYEEKNLAGLKIGWNEIVSKHNAAWLSAGSPSSVSSLSYVKIVLENLGGNAKNMAVNNIRLVKTTQTDSVVINRFEGINYDAEDAVTIMPATEEGLAAYYPAGATLSDNVPEGFEGSSVKLAARATGNDKSFETPVNALAAEKSWLSADEINAWQSAASVSFWLYIPDAAEFKDAMANAKSTEYAAVLFSSSGGAANAAVVDLKANYKYLNNGWNRIVLRLFNAALDVSNINYFNIYNNMGVAQEMEIYGVCVAKSNIMQQGAVINDNESGDPFPNSSNIKELGVYTSVEGWTNVSETEKITAGSLTDSVVASVPSSYVALETSNEALQDWTAEFIAMRFWVYTNNANSLKNSFNYFRAAESAAAYEAGNFYEFSLGGLMLVNGWNQITVRFTEANVNGEVDALALNYFRFDFPATESNKIAFSKVEIFESNSKTTVSLTNKIMEVSDADPDPSHSVVLNATDRIEYWDQYGFGIMPYGPEEGQSSLYLRSESGVIMSRLRARPVDISGFNFNHTVLTFWFYINDASLMSDINAQIELGAGNLEDDSNEYGWDFKLSTLNKIGFESGKWNKIALKIVPNGLTGSNETGMVDLSAIKFFRMYWIDEENAGPSARALISTLTIEEMDTSDFGDGKMMVLQTKDFTEGTTPGTIDEYDLIESADGTFPQQRPGSSGDDGEDDNGEDGKNEEDKKGCGSQSGASVLFVSLVLLGAVSAVLIRKSNKNRS